VRDGERVSSYCPPVTLRLERGIDLANLRLQVRRAARAVGVL
jgi:hypothetical protein